MQQAALIYYLANLVVGLSSMISLSVIAVRTRNALFWKYLVFNVFFTSLIAAITTSLYLEVNFPSLYEAGGAYVRLFIFFSKCGVAFALIGFANYLFDIEKRKLIDSSVFILLFGMVVVRLIGFYDLIPDGDEGGPTPWPITRVMVDGLIVTGLSFLVFLRAFKLDKVAPEEFKKLAKRITLVIAVFSPAIILEVLFYKRWAFAFFSPAMYSTINLVFVFQVTGFFLRHYRPSRDNYRRVVDRGDFALGPFLEEYSITKREEEILLCMLKGSTNKEIADLLFISASTVKAHIYNIFKKTSVRTRYQLFFAVLNRN